MSLTPIPPPPTSPDRPRTHSRNPSLSEMVLNPEAAVPPTSITESINNDEQNLTEHHDALMGAEFKNPETISRQPTLATLGDMPFAHDGSETIEHHRVVATEFVDPVKFEEPEPILQNALVLLDPRKNVFAAVYYFCCQACKSKYISPFSGIPDCNHLIAAGKKRGLMIMAVVPKPSDGSKNADIYPTAAAVSFSTNICIT